MKKADIDALNTLIAFKLAMPPEQDDGRLTYILNHIAELFPDDYSPWRALLEHVRETDAHWRALLEEVESKAPTRAAAAALADDLPGMDTDELHALAERAVQAYLHELGVRAVATRERKLHPDRALWESLRPQYANSRACDIAVADERGLEDAALDGKVKALAEARRRARDKDDPWKGDN